MLNTICELTWKQQIYNSSSFSSSFIVNILLSNLNTNFLIILDAHRHKFGDWYPNQERETFSIAVWLCLQTRFEFEIHCNEDLSWSNLLILYYSISQNFKERSSFTWSSLQRKFCMWRYGFSPPPPYFSVTDRHDIGLPSTPTPAWRNLWMAPKFQTL